jgi:DNA-binding response OmpR family regulator
MRSSGRWLKDLKVLVVEDEFYLADDLARALCEAGAEAVGPVGSVEQAERILADESIDAAILDLNLGGILAGSLVERLSAEHVPCVIVSGYSEDAVPESLRGVPRLEKPVAVGTIISRLAEQLGRPVVVS